MKKQYMALLCLLFAGLCACEQTKPAEKTTATTSMWESTTFEASTTIKIMTNADDPYSYVVADIIKEQSISFARPFIKNCDKYALYDTDGKGTMALFLGGGSSNGLVGEIYTIQNGIAERKLSAYDDSGDYIIRMFRNGIISTAKLDGEGAGGYYGFEDGQLKLIAGLGSYWDDRGVFRVDPTGGERDFFFNFIPDGTEVRITGEEFNRLCEEFWGDLKPAELDWKPLAEYGQ